MTESGSVWSAQDTSPSAIDAALRDLLKERHAAGEAVAPARVLNMVVVVDAEWRGEVTNRLEKVGRYHGSRTIVCAVEEGREQLDAVATVTAEEEGGDGTIAVAREQVVLDVGPGHLAHLDRVVDPLVVMDLPTLVWSPHGHPDAIDALLRLAQIVLVDSVDEPVVAAAVARAAELRERAYVVDLAWLRSTPWRERIAATFDPPQWRGELERIAAVTVRFRPGSTVAGVLLVAWIAQRLGWQPGSLDEPDDRGSCRGDARAADGQVALALEPDPTMPIPGLAGLTIETRSGMSLSLDRGPGGLAAHRRAPDGHESSWTVMGASRGEAGILGEGIRQALLRESGYGGALAVARELVG